MCTGAGDPPSHCRIRVLKVELGGNQMRRLQWYRQQFPGHFFATEEAIAVRKQYANDGQQDNGKLHRLDWSIMADAANYWQQYDGVYY